MEEALGREQRGLAAWSATTATSTAPRDVAHKTHGL